MTKTATIWLRHKKKGTKLKVDLAAWASDLGKHLYRSYERLTEGRGDQSAKQEAKLVEEHEANAKKVMADAASPAQEVRDKRPPDSLRGAGSARPRRTTK